MTWRKLLALTLVIAATSTLWAGTEPVGSITSSVEATVRDTKLSRGSTLYNGDVISVPRNGITQIALANGTQAEILGNSSVRLTKAADKIQIAVDRGQASFRTSGNSGFSALVGDASVRPMNSTDTAAIIQMLSGTHAVIAAEKGALIVTTRRDDKTYTVREGQAADLSAEADPQQDGTAAPAGKAPPTLSVSSKKAVYWTVAIVAAAATVTAYLLWRKETKVPEVVLQNEISPAKLN